MAEQLMSDVLKMQEEENPLEPIEIDPVLLMTEKQIKARLINYHHFKKHFLKMSRNLLKIEKQRKVFVSL